jgi:hypothetical protein
MEMDLQKTKEARRNAPGKEEEGTGCPLEAYNGSGHSIDSLENDTLGHRDGTKRKNSGKDSARTGQPCSVSGSSLLDSSPQTNFRCDEIGNAADPPASFV